ncbi:hypothetical protein [Streptomyces piniterrae]|uniref:hypothetical protein n=1 Tax=Streptomyces piniterrae TaxID=2571125 RepID=UPI00145E40E5|nr:hypothetical protein [Streptomyces piniterrae]
MPKSQNRKSGKERAAKQRADRERKPGMPDMPDMPEESSAERTQDLKPGSHPMPD